MRAFILTIFLVLSISVSAQIDAYQQDIINYLNINGTNQQYSQAYDNMFEVLNERVAAPDTPEKFWDKLKEGKDKSLEDLISIMAFAYRKHFTQAEILEMTTFYKTSAAQKMISNSPNITEEDTAIINAYFESEVAKKVDSVRDDLSVDVSNISEEWSRDLFKQKLGELSKAGYARQK